MKKYLMILLILLLGCVFGCSVKNANEENNTPVDDEKTKTVEQTNNETTNLKTETNIKTDDNEKTETKTETIIETDKSETPVEVEYVTVKFYTKSDVVIDDMILEVGSLIPRVQDLESTETKEFVGWYYEDKIWDFDNDRVTCDMTLTAGWIIGDIFGVKLVVSGPEEMYIGDAYKVQLKVSGYPKIVGESVTWYSNNESVATVDQNGVVTAYSIGTARIRAESNTYPSIKSTYFTIKVSEYIYHEPVDLHGFNIVIMDATSSLNRVDPFLPYYDNEDKLYRQEAWREIEQEYNCTITASGFPELSDFYDRVKWFKAHVEEGNCECDLAAISSAWLPKYVDEGVALDVSMYYGQYFGDAEKENFEKEAGAYKQRLYCAFSGISPTETYPDFGLFYNMDLLEKYNIQDPAVMFNGGYWRYSDFYAWVVDAYNALPKEEDYYVLAGHPYYYFIGLSNAAGIKIIDSANLEVKIDTDEQKSIASMLNKLYTFGYMDPVASWCEIESDGNAWFQGKALMSTGYLWFCKSNARWNGIFGSDTRFGYVPFPYPFEYKEDTRIGYSGVLLYVYLKGRPYPEGVSSEGVYRATNELNLRTYRKMRADNSLDFDKIIDEKLSKQIDNPESVKALKFFKDYNVIYDPYSAIKDKITNQNENLVGACINYVFGTEPDYDEIFSKAINNYKAKVQEIYG